MNILNTSYPSILALVKLLHWRSIDTARSSNTCTYLVCTDPVGSAQLAKSCVKWWGHKQDIVCTHLCVCAHSLRGCSSWVILELHTSDYWVKVPIHCNKFLMFQSKLELPTHNGIHAYLHLQCLYLQFAILTPCTSEARVETWLDVITYACKCQLMDYSM